MKRRNVIFRLLYNIRMKLSRFMEPNWVDVVVNSMQTMEHELAISLAEEADVVIRPSMPLVKWMAFHRSEEMIRQGEEAAESMIDEIHALVRQQTI